MGCHISGDLPVLPAERPAQQLHFPAAGVGVGHVGQSDPGDPLGGDLGGQHMPPEGD
ncbi:hypothetical protein SDC9_80567 [bioreactor metagenome]|uniref:Uncharacterized protein n=1 Tax=bioreactor metagenome TaxID=1076179 RepID=A0A644YZK0_9ZZZZ